MLVLHVWFMKSSRQATKATGAAQGSAQKSCSSILQTSSKVCFQAALKVQCVQFGWFVIFIFGKTLALAYCPINWKSAILQNKKSDLFFPPWELF